MDFIDHEPSNKVVIARFNARVILSESEVNDHVSEFYKGSNSESPFYNLYRMLGLGGEPRWPYEILQPTLIAVGEHELTRIEEDFNKEIIGQAKNRLRIFFRNKEIDSATYEKRMSYLNTIERTAFKFYADVSHGSIRFESGKIVIDLKPLTFLLFTLFGSYEFIANYNDFFEGLDSLRSDINRTYNELARSDLSRYFAELQFDHMPKEELVDRVQLFIRDRKKTLSKFGSADTDDVLSDIIIRH